MNSSLPATPASSEPASEHPETSNDLHVVVIGGGMSGLVAARDCARPGIRVTVLEAADAVGGCVAGREVAGIRVDTGAESFATRGGHVAALIAELGLQHDIVSPNPAGAWVRLPDGTVPLPKAGLLGIPSSPLATDVVRAIGWRGALRAYADRLMPVLKIGREKNLGALVRKRMGSRVLERLVAPVTTGVYSADPDLLDVDVVAPGLNSALTRLGSLSGAVAELRAAAKAGSAVGGIAGGMSRLVGALHDDLLARGAEIHTGVCVMRITAAADREATGIWNLRLADGTVLEADAVILATGASEALRLLAGASDDRTSDEFAAPAGLAALAELDWPDASSVEIVTLVIDAPQLDAAPRGTGVLVAPIPDAHGAVTAKALTHSTAKWAWLAQAAGPGCQVLRLSYGRAGRSDETETLDDAALSELAVADASALLGVGLEASALRGFSRTRWTNALPLAALGERERIGQVRDRVAEVDSLEVVGAWLTGTGLASVIPDSREAAKRIRGLRWRVFTEDP